MEFKSRRHWTRWSFNNNANPITNFISQPPNSLKCQRGFYKAKLVRFSICPFSNSTVNHLETERQPFTYWTVAINFFIFRLFIHGIFIIYFAYLLFLLDIFILHQFTYSINNHLYIYLSFARLLAIYLFNICSFTYSSFNIYLLDICSFTFTTLERKMSNH